MYKIRWRIYITRERQRDRETVGPYELDTEFMNTIDASL